MTVQESEQTDLLKQQTIYLLQHWGAVIRHGDTSVNCAEVKAAQAYSCVEASYGTTSLIALTVTGSQLREAGLLSLIQSVYQIVCQRGGCLVIVTYLTEEDDVKALLRNVCGSSQNAIVWPV